jgi:membrane associated rhomboid family serine protease
MFIPYEVDASFDHRPVVNWLVLLGIILVFVLQVATSEKQAAEKSKKGIETPLEEVLRVPTVENEVATKQVEKKQAVTGPMARFVLDGWGIGLFTYIWLHGGIIRLIGNLIFLWPFGNAVCSKIGNKLYLLVYLGFGLLAGVIHLLLADRTAVGACGVISGIVGMYIVLFPENSISCFFLLPRPMAASILGYWVVALWFIFDLLEAGLSGQSTTYCAHILCVGAGFGLAVLMLKKKWLVMESGEKSLLQMLSKKEKEDLSFVAPVLRSVSEEGSAKKEEKGRQEGEKKGEKEEKKDLEAVEKQLKPADREKAEPKKTVPEAEKPEDDFVRFRCECGHRIKLHKKDAGKTGRCPKCSRWLEAPRG